MKRPIEAEVHVGFFLYNFFSFKQNVFGRRSRALMMKYEEVGEGVLERQAMAFPGAVVQRGEWDGRNGFRRFDRRRVVFVG